MDEKRGALHQKNYLQLRKLTKDGDRSVTTSRACDIQHCGPTLDTVLSV